MVANISDAAATTGWVQISLVVLGVLVVLTYAVYLLALPKPLPGIPYNKQSANRLLGDIPEITELENAGKTGRLFWGEMAVKHSSPITQCFLGPFAKPSIIVSDYREAQDLMLRRGKELGRGKLNREAWRGIVPEHFIGMEDHDERYKDTKGLVKDLMTPKFLHEVSTSLPCEKAGGTNAFPGELPGIVSKSSGLHQTLAAKGRNRRGPRVQRIARSLCSNLRHYHGGCIGIRRQRK